jgi:hypothetical protein
MMSLLDTLAKSFLFFSNDIFYAPLLFLGLIGLRRTWIGPVTLLLVWTILFNAYLKNCFQIPMNPEIGKTGFVFPSGHTQWSVVFFGWAFSQCRFLSFRWVFIGIMTGIGWGLVHFHYHSWIDVWGGVGFAVTTLVLYQLIAEAIMKWRPYSRVPSEVWVGWILGILGTLILVDLNRSHALSPPIWMGYHALWGLTLSRQIFSKSQSRPSTGFSFKLLAIGVSGVFITLIWGIFSILQWLECFPPGALQFKWFWIAASSEISLYVVWVFKVDRLNRVHCADVT